MTKYYLIRKDSSSLIAISDRCDSGVHSLVCAVSVELPTSGRNDGSARCVNGPLSDQSLDDEILAAAGKGFRKYKRPVGTSWRIDQTCIKVKGVRKYLYRAVDKEGKTIDFLLMATRDKAAAKRFFDKAMQASGVPEKVTMEKSGANKAAIDEINADRGTPIIVRQVKYLHNIVEQDHRAVKHVTKPMLNFKSLRSAKNKTGPRLRDRTRCPALHA